MCYSLYPFKHFHIFFTSSFGHCRLLVGPWDRLFALLSSHYTVFQGLCGVWIINDIMTSVALFSIFQGASHMKK
jgi:hypothetical protein